MGDLESLVALFAAHPYLGVALVFVLCGLGLPLPEEIVLVVAGYLCYRFPERTEVPRMMAACASGILVGDVLPFLLGRVFGPRLLRLRLVRLVISRQRLFIFDRWFRRRGDLVIFFARFVPGLRVVAFFTAATMRMRLRRFLLLDLLGIGLFVPALVWVGWHFGPIIHDAIEWVRRVERGIFVTAVVAVAVVGVWYWLRRRRKRRALVDGPAETFVGPSQPPPA